MLGALTAIQNPVSMVGVTLTTTAALLFLVVFLADLFGMHTNPYVGILFFILFPALFLLGLVLIPIGSWQARRRRAAGLPPATVQWPRLDLNDPKQRRTVALVTVLTLAKW